MKISNLTTYLAVLWWQGQYNFHPMTCLHHSDEKLTAVEIDGEIRMVCPKFGCGYSQSVPQIVIDYYKKVYK